jgi:hypothetical protein
VCNFHGRSHSTIERPKLQIAAAALGQQCGELGQEYARAGFSIPNTLEIRPDCRFVVMINRDMLMRYTLITAP